MDLPSFLWLWKAAAWSMGFAVFAYVLLAFSGAHIFSLRQQQQPRAPWLTVFHAITGTIMIALVLFLLGIGFVGTLGHYGSLGHSTHLPAGLAVVELVFLSAWSAVQIRFGRPWARPLHIGINLTLLIAFILVSITGWSVVQKYLP